MSVGVIFWVIFSLFSFSSLYFGGVFNKTIILFAVVGYEMITITITTIIIISLYPFTKFSL